jgi:hypothetical protein
MPSHYKHEENISEGRVHEVTEQRVCKPFISRMKDNADVAKLQVQELGEIYLQTTQCSINSGSLIHTPTLMSA